VLREAILNERVFAVSAPVAGFGRRWSGASRLVFRTGCCMD
jgi:hypothetical protein